MASDYRLDDLGWYQFERLCQALLKARYGAGVEAWGGGKDFGRDAYAEGPLAFPDPTVSTDGPFVFQVKFVAGANASGANPMPSLLTAVRAELVRIQERVDAEEWDEPAVYCLMTNVVVTAKGREALLALLEPALGDARVVVEGAQDLAAQLDGSSSVRLAYPQILGLRDLKGLLHEAVAADVVKRSSISLEALAPLAEVFVATDAYKRTLQLLDAHGFAVLTGPPEMGKTATARIIALARFSSGWDAIDCRSPAEFFRMHDRERSQLFVADDTFGSTEYRPDVASEWAAQLDVVLAACDRRHWLIWTSRPGPLRIGLQRLHLQGVASNFPDLNTVVVDASRLSLAEKAQILYRHAKAAELTPEGTALIKRAAHSIVANQHFTPFRIRRLIREQLPTILTLPAADQASRLREAVYQGLLEPTAAMRNSFTALPPDARNLMIAMLDSGDGSRPLEAVEKRLAELSSGNLETSAASLAELVEDHFLRMEAGA